MRDVPLDERSITQLRTMAQSVDAEFTFADDRETLIEAIRNNRDKPPKEKPPLIKWKTDAK